MLALALLAACGPANLTSTLTPTATASPTPAPSRTPEPNPPPPLPTPSETSPPSATPTATAVPPLTGSFDVYLSRPASDGSQTLMWIDTATAEVVTQIDIRAEDGRAIRGGQHIYFVEQATHQPVRVNTAGAAEVIAFAVPPPGAADYQILPSINGTHLVWASVSADGVTYQIGAARSDGVGAREVVRGQIEPGTSIDLLRVTIDGARLIFALKPPHITDATQFNAAYDLYSLNLITGEVVHLPGEPACGQRGDKPLVCDAYVSPDGAYLARTLTPQALGTVVVTNLVTGAEVARFEPLDVPLGAIYEIGYPLFTPSGDLIFFESIGPEAIREYRLVLGNTVTGQASAIAVLSDLHRPIGWTGSGFILLTTREPDTYDTWQIDIRSGQVRLVASNLFIGHVEVAP